MHFKILINHENLSRHCEFFKIKVLKDETKESEEKFVEESVAPKSFLFTDKNTAYYNLERLVEEHVKVKSSPDSTKGDLN